MLFPCPAVFVQGRGKGRFSPKASLVMTFRRLWRAAFVLLFGSVVVSSCIKDEALNAEADIVACAVDGDMLIRQPVITNSEIRLYVNGWDDVTNVSPTFTLTEGATIEPASGTARDFTRPQRYTVTSQDGRWKKTYTVSFVSEDLVTEYHFEDVRFYEYTSFWNPMAAPKKQYHIFYDRSADGTVTDWGSGNAGYAIAHSDAPASEYPTSQADEGYRGKCAKLVTRSTGKLGADFGAPLAAGNLFVGTFKTNIFNMEKSTRFGVPFRRMPQAIDGYYKYKAGEKYTDKKSVEHKDKKDMFDIYAVMYEVTDTVPYLDGANVKTHPSIVLMAQVNDRKETDEWTRFTAAFKPVGNKTVDPEKLRNGKYNLAIVMSSSEGGAYFNGAVGSTLYVDEMKLYYE